MDDVSAFVAGWLSRGWATNRDRYLHGDMNFDGVTDLRDSYILANNYPAAAQLDVEALVHRVPEPAAWLMAVLVAIGGVRCQRVRWR